MWGNKRLTFVTGSDMYHRKEINEVSLLVAVLQTEYVLFFLLVEMIKKPELKRTALEKG